jgi:hypothetical protein
MIERAAAAVMVLALLGTSCSGASDQEDAASSVTPAAVDASNVVADDAAPAVTLADGDPSGLGGDELEAYVANRYEAYWDAYDAARNAPSASPSSDFPILTDLAAGEQLDVSYESLIELAEKGEAIREPDTPAIGGVDADAEHRVRVELIDDSLAEISACVVNDDVRHVVASDAVVRDTVSTVASVATMALTEGEWKLIRSRAVDIADGVTGCWLTDDAEYPY